MSTATVLIVSLTLLFNSALADPQITAAARLVPRQTESNPAFVGYISENGGYSDPRSCGYPQTVSTSGAYVQCCPTTGSCPFYTACSSNTLIAANETVACYVNSALTCNTGLVFTTPGANGAGSYLACWQKTLGSSPFTFVQNIGSTTGSRSSASSTGAAMSSSATQSSATVSQTSMGGSTAASATSAVSSAASSAGSSSKNVGNAVTGDFGLGSAVGGVVGLLIHALL